MCGPDQTLIEWILMTKPYNPCVKICKYREDGHCVGCSMTKTQKKISKRLKSKDTKAAFLRLIRMQQNCLGGYEDWERDHVARYHSKN